MDGNTEIACSSFLFATTPKIVIQKHGRLSSVTYSWFSLRGLFCPSSHGHEHDFVLVLQYIFSCKPSSLGYKYSTSILLQLKIHNFFSLLVHCTKFNPQNPLPNHGKHTNSNSIHKRHQQPNPIHSPLLLIQPLRPLPAHSLFPLHLRRTHRPRHMALHSRSQRPKSTSLTSNRPLRYRSCEPEQKDRRLCMAATF